MTIPLTLRFDILQRDNFTCRFCGKRAPETELEVDHLRPRSREGTDDEDNLVTTCRDCNRGKGDRVIDLPLDNSKNDLVGMFFHGFSSSDSRHPDWQGHIIARVSQEHYLVEFFEWLDGYLSGVSRLVSLTDMVDNSWCFYRTREDMCHTYEYSYAKLTIDDAESQKELGHALGNR